MSYIIRLISKSGVSCQDPLAYLYEQQENLDTGALAGFGQQVVFIFFQSSQDEIEDQYKYVLAC